MAVDKTTVQKREAETVGSVERTRNTRVFLPPVDIYETHDDIVLLADMPGVNKDAIDITLEQNVLTIRAKAEPQVPEGYELAYAEYEVGDYERSFTLDETVDQERIEASYQNGVLQLRLPKAEPAKPKKIEVKVA
ncbi:MAG: Hsp20/alpha crystallin family protein [Calditrichaeota bacterium]|nr:MAG: Hsp20/alpha crystallin family protein [Calditrichota bacterium]